MEVKADSRQFHEIECDALVVAVFEGEKPDEGALAEINKRSNGVVTSLVETGELTGKSGESAYVHNPGDMKARRLLLLGVGKKEELTADDVRKMAGTAARTLRGKKARSFAILRRSQLPIGEGAQAATEGALISLFDPDKYHTSDKTENPLQEMILAVPGADVDEVKRAIERGRIVADATNFAREMINEPANVITPTELARHAEAVAKEHGLEIDVLDDARMKDLGMGAFLGVAQGSAEPAKIIVLTYSPKTESKETIAIVGKGITFDTGGISIKPSDGMEKMKYDMAGGATTIGVMRVIAQLKSQVKVIGVVPTIENMPGGRVQRPGDVVRAMSGKTIEVINTDAEG